jgi:serine/threonine protein kinase
MKTILVSNFLSTNIYSEFQNVNTIEIGNDPIAEGAFGEVYLCISINNQTLTNPQVIKIFKEDSHNKQNHNYDTIVKLQKKLDLKNKNLIKAKQRTILEEYPALKAIPQLSFKGKLNNKEIRGFASNNLKKLGFEEFIQILDNDNLYKNYQKIGIDKKMLISYHFISAFKLLNEIFFIHADLKPEAIFINTITNECAIIDYDSGAIAEKATDAPNVWGAPNDWVAPEIWEQLKLVNTNGIQKIKVNLLSDLWSVSVGVHYLLTTTHPLFYLSELSPRVTNQYFTKYKWPNIDENENYFNKQNATIYKPIVNWLENVLPKQIYSEFEKTMNYGYNNPVNRTTYNQWEKVLLNVQAPPKIIQFISDRDIIIDGIPVKLSWHVEGFYKLFLIDNSSSIDVTTLSEINLMPNIDSKFVLKAHGHFGEDIKEIHIRVFPLPVIKTLLIPTPQFNHHLNLSNLHISTPNINVGVELNQSVFKTDNIDFVKVSDLVKTKYLSNNNINPISELFEKLQESIKNRLLNRFKNVKNQ